MALSAVKSGEVREGGSSARPCALQGRRKSTPGPRLGVGNPDKGYTGSLSYWSGEMRFGNSEGRVSLVSDFRSGPGAWVDGGVRRKSVGL